MLTRRRKLSKLPNARLASCDWSPHPFPVADPQRQEPASPEEQLSKFKSPQTMSNATSSSGLAVLDEEVDFRKSASQSRSMSSCSQRMALSSVGQNHREPMMKLQPDLTRPRQIPTGLRKIPHPGKSSGCRTLPSRACRCVQVMYPTILWS